MKILVVGCERSGTKMLAAKLGDENQVEFSLENKHTISSFRYYQELQKWNNYVSAPVPTIHTKDHEKHSLNHEVNIDFLKSQVEKLQSDVEKLKDKVRKNNGGQ